MNRKELIKIYGEITDCPFCDGYMVPSKIDYEGVFRGKKLLITISQFLNVKQMAAVKLLTG